MSALPLKADMRDPCPARRIEGQQHHRDLSDAGSDGDRFFQRADMMDTKVGADKKDVHNKMQAVAAHVMPAERHAKQHTKMAAPGTATK